MQSNSATKSIAISILAAEYEGDDFQTWDERGHSEVEKIMFDAHYAWRQAYTNWRGYDYYGNGEVEPNDQPPIKFWRGSYEVWRFGMPTYLGGFPQDKQIDQPWLVYRYPHMRHTLKRDIFKV